MRFATAVFGLALLGSSTPSGEMPPNTIPLSQMMQQLSAQPGFTERFLQVIQGKDRKTGAALLTPKLVDHLRDLIVGKDWQGLDRFPGWTMGEINPVVSVVGKVAGEKAISDSSAKLSERDPDNPYRIMERFLDLSLTDDGWSEHTPIDRIYTEPTFDKDEPISSLGDGATRGDGPNPQLAQLHGESQNLAWLLNRLGANGLFGERLFAGTLNRQTLTSPEAVISALQQSGHTVTVTDTRYFANFGHLHYDGEDVMMPFWVNTQLIVPNTRPARPLLVPVSHAEYEWHIRGPLMNADVSFYFGIDGKAEFRTMDQLDQAWVMKRDAHTYTGDDAVEVTRLAGAVVRTYERLHQAYPTMPFGGYYAFGVCQDVVAAIELKMTGKNTLFPNTADDQYFTDPRDAEINDLIKRLPKDRDGKPPSPERIFGSLPVGSSDKELATVTIPGLAPDLIAVHDAWTNGTLENVGERRRIRNLLYWLGALLAFSLVWALRRHRAKVERLR
jgi:hypothetical protein